MAAGGGSVRNGAWALLKVDATAAATTCSCWSSVASYRCSLATGRTAALPRDKPSTKPRLQRGRICTASRQPASATTPHDGKASRGKRRASATQSRRDRKSVMEGKRASVGVDAGGGRIIKKKT